MTGVGGAQPTPGQQLGSALKELQQRSGKTLRDLESEVMISDSSLSRYLRGTTVPPWATVRDLCRALHADPALYRQLWEAADRCQVKAPPTSAAPQGGSPRRRLRDAFAARSANRWWWAGAGALAGLLLGAVLTWVAVPKDPAAGRHTAAGPTGATSGGDEKAAGGREAGKKDAGTAQGPDDQIRIFVNRATGSCLDHSLDKGLRSFAPNGMSYQRWTVHTGPDGAGELKNHATGACLDGGDDGAGDGARALSCSGSASQKWSITHWSDASVEVKSRSTGRCLGDGPAGLLTGSCDRSAAQRWG
ncbi:helix-turn-helix domain-containing protein [Streptomyces sp. NPDC051555]|uniref:helix-turn-helix domain-containing protein n=1 Tax=Streptomyces sp. NPDC051555 TaxID=3365657 RepID=UPI00379F064A